MVIKQVLLMAGMRMLVATILVLSSFFASAAAPASTSSPRILVSIKPLQLIVQLLQEPLQAHAITPEVSTLLPQGATPHDYTLKPSDLLRVLEADLVIWMGPVVEPYLATIIGRVDTHKVIDVSQLSTLQRLPVRTLLENTPPAMVDDAEDHTEEHQHGDHHHDMAFDPHLWWSVHNAQRIAQHVLQALGKSTALAQQSLAAVIQSMKTELAEKQSHARKQPPVFMVFHDGLQYLEFDLGVHSVARIALDDDHAPGIKTLLSLRRRVKETQVLCVVAEQNTNLAIIRKIESDIPLRIVTVDSLGWGMIDYQAMLSQAYDKILSCHP